MEIEQLIKELNDLNKQSMKGGDTEIIHIEADELLLKYINDKEVSKAFERINKWYA